MDIYLKTPDGRRYHPLPTQALFHASQAQHRSLIAGFGNGKTLAGAMEVLLLALEYPPGQPGLGLVARYEYRGLEKSTWKTLTDIIPPQIIKDVNRSDPSITLKTGFQFLGWNLKSHQKLASLNLALAWIDECNEDGIERSVYDQIRGRCRDPLGSRKTILTGNPAGKNWVYELFFAHKLEGAKAYAGHEGFQALPLENTYLPPDYLDGLREIYDDVWIEKYLKGNFDVFEGQVFDTFRRELHVVPAYRPPDTWPRFRGLDHGLVNPTACVWLAADFHGNFLVYRCYYQRSSTPAENAGNILRLSDGEAIDWTVIDPSTHQQQAAGGTSERIIDQYRMAGLTCEPGNNAVRDSIARIRQLLQPDPNHEFPHWHPRAGEKGSPRLFFTADCTELIWEIGQYQWKQVRPGQKDREVPASVHDHAIDALRYVVMRSPRPAVESAQPLLYDRFIAISNELRGEGPDTGLYANIIGNEGIPARRGALR